MSESGFKAVSNATEMFLTEQDADSDVLVGLAFTVIMDGSRTFIIEVQVIFELSLYKKITVMSFATMGWVVVM